MDFQTEDNGLLAKGDTLGSPYSPTTDFGHEHPPDVPPSMYSSDRTNGNDHEDDDKGYDSGLGGDESETESATNSVDGKEVIYGRFYSRDARESYRCPTDEVRSP
ncbi:hypothetical protein LX36DRAFT_662364 [Colletotrichum falcatum]|nr:hypothetical protein LX36DRAFT_662364 [Colletotrichum falcatum]